MRYQFTDDLLTGNSTIDDEHRTLIKAADDIMEKVASGQGKESLDKAIIFLSDYTKTHFATEEVLQEKSKYPEIVPHKAWHKKFSSELQEVANNIVKTGASSLMVIELTTKVSSLINHIKTEDRKLATHIAKS